MSLLDFACNGVDDLRCVVFEWGDELDERELVLIVHDLVFHSLDFEDVPLVAVADVDLAGALVCGSHRIHCEFERFLLEGVAIFEFAEDTIAGCDA